MRYFFEDCALDTDRRELRRGPDVVPTTPQVLDLLEYLIRSRDRVVSKDDLVNAIWNGRIVSDAALTTRLNAVRRAIGDSGEQQRLIKTFPRKGFRFVGAVHDEDRRPGTAVVSDALTELSKLARAAGKAAVSVPDPSEEVVGKWRSDGLAYVLGLPIPSFSSCLTNDASVNRAGGFVKCCSAFISTAANSCPTLTGGNCCSEVGVGQTFVKPSKTRTLPPALYRH